MRAAVSLIAVSLPGVAACILFGVVSVGSALAAAGTLAARGYRASNGRMGGGQVLRGRRTSGQW
eukprot:8354987-Alexandrium_andersonii.AAC.1